jgi:hypothetical protein
MEEKEKGIELVLKPDEKDCALRDGTRRSGRT